MYQNRKNVERNVLSSHGDATRYFVTFLDNHDVKERIRFVDPANTAEFDAQVTLGLACLYSLPGIPCLYYGTEQGLHGAGNDEAVREALWGGPGFNQGSKFYQHIQQIAAVRESPFPVRALRFADDAAEARWVADDLRDELRSSGLARGDFAVLYRNHQTGQRLEEALIAAGISIVIVTVVNGMGTQLNNKYQSVSTALK